MATIADLLVKVGADITGLQNSLATAEQNISSFAGGLTAEGGALMKLGLPLVGFGALAAKTAGDFEAQMNILAIAAGGGGTSLEDLRNVAIKAGQDVTLVGVSASDVAGAMTNFTKSGLDTNQMLGDMNGYLSGTTQLGGALRAAIDLAAASELNLDQASRLVTTTMSTYGLTADQVVGAMDNYVRTADASVASVSDLAAAMDNIGPTMAAFGFSLADVNTALAILSTRGIVGAEAGTALKSMFTNMMRDTPEVKKALDDLNVTLYDQNGAMLPLPAIIAQLSTALGGMSDEQRNAYIQTIAGTYGMKAMNTLVSEGVPGWNNMTTAIGSAATMQESAAGQTKGFNAAMENLKSTVETFLINVGTPLINDVLTPLVAKLTEVMGGLADVNPKFLELAIVGGAIVTGLGAVLVVVGQVAGAIGALAGLFGTGGAFAAIGPAVAGLAGPFAIIAGVVAALVVAWNTNFLEIQSIVGGLKTTVDMAFQFIKGVFDGFGAFLRGEITWDEFVARVEQSFANLRNYLDSIWQEIGQKVSAAWAQLKTNIGQWLSGIVYDVEMGLANIIGAITGNHDQALAIVQVKWFQIQRVFSDAFKAISDFWTQTLQPVFASLVTWFETNIPNAIKAVSDYWTTYLLPAIQTVWQGIQNNLIPVIRDMAGWLANNLVSAVQNAVTWFDQHLLPIIRDVATFLVQNVIPALRDVATWLLQNLGQAIVAAAGWFANSLLPAVRDVWNFFKTYLWPVLEGVANVLTAILGKAVDALAGLWQKVLYPALVTVWNFIQTTLGPVFDKLGQSLGSGGAVGKAIDWVKGLFEKMGPALETVKGVLEKVAGFFGDLATKINSLKLPSWLTPGSPTPLETALLGILSALSALARGPWDFLGKLASGLFGGGGGTTVNINVTVAKGAVSVVGDAASMGETVGNAIAKTLAALTKAEGKYGPSGGWGLP